MKAEERTIKAGVLAGATDILIGLAMYYLGWADWYFDKFHFFGIMGIAMLIYSYWHIYFYQKETGRRVMSWKKLTQ